MPVKSIKSIAYFRGWHNAYKLLPINRVRVFLLQLTPAILDKRLIGILPQVRVSGYLGLIVIC